MLETEKERIIENVFHDLPTLVTPRLILRKMRLEDAADMYEYARNPEVSRYTIWDAHASIEKTLAFLRCVVKNYEEGAVEDWGMVYKENDKFIGTCGYFMWDPEHRRAEIHYAMSSAFSGRGLMTEAVREVIRFGFDAMGFNRIAASAMLPNVASERVMQKAGMKFEGIMRDAVMAKGTSHDLKVYAITRNDYETQRETAR